ncbi:MAG: hypothetical protein MUO21_05170 [Nitrososphaeraceae archaeon]|nr:hypothetical protein [Nitrososphaeraceae archaeon]
MEILEDRDLAKYLFDKYSTNQRKWNFIISTSPVKDAFFDAIVSNPDEVWQLKIDSIYKPNPFVMGTKTTTDSSTIEKKLENTSQFGYRKLELDVLKNFLRTISEEENNNSINTMDVNFRLNSLLSSLYPVKPTKGYNYLYGPFIFTEKKMTKFNNKQDEISEKLSYRMHENIRRKYSSYG